MAETINYGSLMHAALRRLIVEVLEQVAQDGLPGKHHFFITFDTTHPGVDMSRSLMERYPSEMTIVMQDWFEDLAVMKDRFAVTLNFGNTPEMLVIPFTAIKTFVDPSVEFGLRFDAQDEAGLSDTEELEVVDASDEPVKADAEVVSLDQFRKH